MQRLSRGKRRAGGGKARQRFPRAPLPAFQNIVDALSDHIAILDARADIIAVNTSWQGFAQDNGLRTPDCGLGANYLAVCDAAVGPGAEEAPLVAAGIRRLLAEKQGEFRCDYPCHSPAQQRWFQLRATCLQDRSRFHIVLAHQRITALWQGHELLLSSALNHSGRQLRGAISERQQAELDRDRLAAIVESSEDAIISNDLQGTITSWNASAEKLFGYRADEVLGQSITLVFLPDKQFEAAAILERLRRGEPVERQERVLRTRDDRPIIVSLTVSTVRDASGEVIGASKIIHDITERKRAEEALRQAHAELESRVRERTADLAKANEALRNSERRLANLAAATFEGIAITEAGRFVDTNEQLAHLLGFTREELLGRAIEALLPPEDRPRVLPSILAGRESHVEHEMIRKDGTRLIVEAHGQTAEVEGRAIRFTALRDITERRRMEESLARYTEGLDRLVAERTSELNESVEELEHFSYALLHDLRAPLRAMMSFANLIELKCKASCQQLEVLDYLKRIKASSERMDHLVRDALNYTRVLRRDFPVRPVALLPLLQGLLESYPELWPHQTEIHLAPNLPVVLGNEAVLTECFSNLLRNAIKFVAPGITPRVRVWAEEVRSAECGVRSEDTGKAVPGSETRLQRVWVEDNGIGIPEDSYEAIFTMFRQVHTLDVYPGTGIGLAIVRKGIQRIGGRVGVESELAKGSRFWLELKGVETAAPGEG